MRKMLLTSIAILLFTTSVFTQTITAPKSSPKPNEVNIGEFVKELMQLDVNSDKQHLALWIPYEFFVASVVSQRQQSQAEVEKELDFLKGYITMLVQSSVEEPDGTSVYADEKEVRARAVLRASDGSESMPLDRVPPLVSATLAAMKAVIAAEGDKGSANLHILVFAGTTKTGKKVIDATKRDTLTLRLKANSTYRDISFIWRTPFDALVHSSDCPRCKAGVSAKWTYCPYCGEKLPHE